MDIIDKEMKKLLKVQGLNKSFKEKQVLKDISFQIKEGQIVAILGPSGAGKTTLLRCINGLELCDAGDIEIDEMFLCKEEEGKSVYASSKEKGAIRRKLGMVFQSFNLFPHRSVLENIVEAPINVLGFSKKEAEDTAMRLLKELGLEEKAKAYPYELSGGQKQRVAIARACALEPNIICFDEPTSALDPELREDVAAIIEKLAKKNMAVLIITHDMDFAKRVAERVIFMEEGQIIEDAAKEEFFNSPKGGRVQKFVLKY